MARLTITPSIYKTARTKDGLYPIRITVYLNGKTKRITTSLTARPDQLTRSLAVRDSQLSAQIDAVVRRMRDAANEIDPFLLDSMTVDQAVDVINKTISGDSEVFRLDFMEYWKGIAEKKSKGSRINYLSSLHSFQRFVEKDAMDISEVTSSLIRKYQASLEEKHSKNARCISLYLGAMAHVHAQARAEYNDEEIGRIRVRNPFAYFKVPAMPRAAHRNVDRSIIDNMLSRRSGLTGSMRIAVDAFLLSFGLMGMNAADMYQAAKPEEDIIIYNRAKTRDRRSDHAEMRVKIDTLIRPLFDAYSGKTRALSFCDIYASERTFSVCVSRGLRRYCDHYKEPAFTFYSARHTWASLAYSAGVEKAIINDCLCHVDPDMRVTDIYIAKDWRRLWRANKKVLRLFDWKAI